MSPSLHWFSSEFPDIMILISKWFFLIGIGNKDSYMGVDELENIQSTMLKIQWIQHKYKHFILII